MPIKVLYTCSLDNSHFCMGNILVGDVERVCRLLDYDIIRKYWTIHHFCNNHSTPLHKIDKEENKFTNSSIYIMYIHIFICIISTLFCDL